MKEISTVSNHRTRYVALTIEGVIGSTRKKLQDATNLERRASHNNKNNNNNNNNNNTNNNNSPRSPPSMVPCPSVSSPL